MLALSQQGYGPHAPSLCLPGIVASLLAAHQNCMEERDNALHQAKELTSRYGRLLKAADTITAHAWQEEGQDFLRGTPPAKRRRAVDAEIRAALTTVSQAVSGSRPGSQVNSAAPSPAVPAANGGAQRSVQLPLASLRRGEPPSFGAMMHAAGSRRGSLLAPEDTATCLAVEADQDACTQRVSGAAEQGAPSQQALPVSALADLPEDPSLPPLEVVERAGVQRVRGRPKHRGRRTGALRIGAE